MRTGKRICILLLVLCLLSALSGCDFMIVSKDSSESIPLSSESLKELSLIFSSGNLVFRITDGAPRLDYTIHASGIMSGMPTLHMDSHGRKTEIYLKNPVFSLLRGFRCDMEIYLPKQAVSELSMTFTSGHVELSDIQLDELQISMTSGNLIAERMEANRLMISETGGDVDLNGQFREIRADLTSGDLRIICERQPEQVYFDVTSGVADLTIPADSAGFTLDFTRTSGSVTTDFETSGAVSGSALEKNGHLIYGDGSAEYEIHVTSGSARVLRP